MIDSSTFTPDEMSLRITALDAALKTSAHIGSHEEVLRIARAYYKFLRGDTKDAPTEVRKAA